MKKMEKEKKKQLLTYILNGHNSRIVMPEERVGETEDRLTEMIPVDRE